MLAFAGEILFYGFTVATSNAIEYDTYILDTRMYSYKNGVMINVF